MENAGALLPQITESLINDKRMLSKTINDWTSELMFLKHLQTHSEHQFQRMYRHYSNSVNHVPFHTSIPLLQFLFATVLH